MSSSNFLELHSKETNWDVDAETMVKKIYKNQKKKKKIFKIIASSKIKTFHRFIYNSIQPTNKKHRKLFKKYKLSRNSTFTSNKLHKTNGNVTIYRTRC